MFEKFRKRKSLQLLFLGHKGKVADKWESYLDIYEDEFAKYRQTKFPILEIGVQNCGSLEIWAKYFYNSEKVLGVDIEERLRDLSFDDGRIETFISDANYLYKHFSRKFKNPIVIIDDASHQSKDIVNTFLTMFPLLKDDGVYVVEDLCCSYWTEFNKETPMSSMGFFKLLVDVINYEHWDKNEKLKQQIDILGVVQFDQLKAVMNSIKSVRFFNSMCFIKKTEKKSSNKIRKRIVVGDECVLEFKAINGQSINELKCTKRDFAFDDSDLVN